MKSIASRGDCHRGWERIQRVAKKSIIWWYETPLIFLDIVNLTGHFVISTNYVDFILTWRWQIKAFMRYSQLVHVVELFPSLADHIKHMDLTIPISVFTSDQNNLCRRDRKCATSPKRIFHSYCQICPLILFNLVYFDTVINFLLRAAKKSTESINKFVIHSACT